MWEERFAKDGYLFGTEPVPFLLKHDALFQAGESGLLNVEYAPCYVQDIV